MIRGLAKIAYLFVILVAAADLQAAAKSCGALPANKQKPNYKLNIGGLEHYPELKILESAVREYLDAFARSMPIPEVISISPFSPNEVQYIYGLIKTRFPMCKQWDTENDIPIGEVKTPEDSVPIALHELTHQIFENYIIQRFQNSDPVTIWAFFFNPHDSEVQIGDEFLKATVARTAYRDMPKEDLEDLFFKIMLDSITLYEFLADMGPILFFDDPEAIYRSINFKEDGNFNHFRRLNVQITERDLPTIKDRDHVSTFIAKKFFWEVIRPRIRQTMNFGDIMLRLFNVMIRTLPELSDGYQRPRTKARDTIALNRILIKNLCEEFKISDWRYPRILR